MGHDDTIDALAYACKYSQPPVGITSDDDKNYRWKKPKVKSWIVS